MTSNRWTSDEPSDALLPVRELPHGTAGLRRAPFRACREAQDGTRGRKGRQASFRGHLRTPLAPLPQCNRRAVTVRFMPARGCVADGTPCSWATARALPHLSDALFRRVQSVAGGTKGMMRTGASLRIDRFDRLRFSRISRRNCRARRSLAQRQLSGLEDNGAAAGCPTDRIHRQ